MDSKTQMPVKGYKAKGGFNGWRWLSLCLVIALAYLALKGKPPKHVEVIGKFVSASYYLRMVVDGKTEIVEISKEKFDAIDEDELNYYSKGTK